MTRARNSANLASHGNLFVDIANDRTGIGSVVPGQNLHVAGTAGFHADVTFTGDLYNTIWDRSDNSLKFADLAKAEFGAGGDFKIRHDPSMFGGVYNRYDHYNGNVWFVNRDTTNKYMYIRSDDIQLRDWTGNKAYIHCANSLDVKLFYNNSERFVTTTYGTNTTGTAVNDGLVVAGVATVTTMNVTGVLTYDDVTSVDSVGIVTARQGVVIPSSNQKIVIGPSGNLEMFYSSSHGSLLNTSDGGDIRFRIGGNTRTTVSSNGLSVSGELSVGASVLITDSIKHTGDTNTRIRFPADDTISFETSGAERVRIDSGGRLLVGRTTGNSANLLVQSGAQVFAGANNGNSSCLTMDYNTANGAGRIMGHASSGGMLQFFTNASGAGVTPKLTIDSNGDMALGGSPITSGYTSFTIHEPGTGSGSHARFNMTTGNTGNTGSDGFSITVNASTNNIHYIQREAADMAFQNTGGERLRIKSNGDVAINGTSTTDAKLDVRTDRDPTTGVVVLAKNNTANGNGTFYMCDINSVGNWSFGMPDNTNVFAIVKGIGNSGTEYLRIGSSGNVYIGQTSGSEQLGVNGGNNSQTFSTNSTNSNGNMLQVKCSGTTKLFLGSAGSFITGNTGTTNQGIRAEGALLFAAGGHTERARITSGGDFGIGISNPAVLTHIYDSTDTSSATEQLRISGGDRTADTFETGFRFFTQSPSANGNRHIRFTSNGNTGLTIQAHETSTGNAAVDRNILLCPSGGNIGINESNPSTKLHVENDNANSTYYLNTDAAILVQNKNSNATAKTVLKLEGPVGGGDCALVYGSSSTNLIISDRQHERLRINKGGDVTMNSHLNVAGITTSVFGLKFGSGGKHYLYESASDTATLRITSDGPYAEFKDVSGDVQMGSASGTLRLSAGGGMVLTVDSDGDFKQGTNTPAPFNSSAPSQMRFLSKKCGQGCVTSTTTLAANGTGTFDLGRLWITDDSSIELYIQVMRNDSTLYQTHHCKAFIQKVRGSGMSQGEITYQNGAAYSSGSGFRVTGIQAGGYTGSGGSSHGTQITVAGGAGGVIYRATAFWTVLSKNNMY